MLLPFSATAGYGVDKPSGRPCHHLTERDGCGIHATLREDGWPGCTVFECFGAGQQVSQVTYGGVSWRQQDNLGEMAAVLSVMRQLHEMLVHLDEVARRSPDDAAAATRAEIGELTGADPERCCSPTSTGSTRGWAPSSPMRASAYAGPTPRRGTGRGTTWPDTAWRVTTVAGRSAVR